MLELTVNGKDHSGWLNMEIARSMQELCGSYSLGLTDPSVGTNNFLIRAGNLCRITIRNKDTDPRFQIMQGYVEALDGEGGKDSDSYSVSGRDRTGDLVDSAIVRQGEWNAPDFTFVNLVSDLASDFGINVVVDSSLDLSQPIGSVQYDQGTTYSDLIAEYAQKLQVLVYTLPSGELFITRASKTRGSLSLVEGKNILRRGFKADWTNVFKEYIVKGSRQSEPNDPEEDVTQVEGCATDSRFPRPRATIITPDTEMTAESAQQLADWNASTRIPNAESWWVEVQGWIPVMNQLAYVKIPRYELDGDYLIEGYRLTADDGGKKTVFNIVHPRSFDLLPGNTVTADSKDSKALDVQ